MKTEWSLQHVRTLLSLVFVSHLHPLLSCASSVFNMQSYNNDSSLDPYTLISRTKRQFGGGGFMSFGGGGYCPPDCFQCNFNQCNQIYQQGQHPRCMPMIINCCCRSQKVDIKTACDGDEAVAGCMNGLCGQGYYCTRRQFCCRCLTGKSIGEAVNGMCPVGYAANANNFCCAIGAGSVLGKCINGRCPTGYDCGAGELCYAKSSVALSTSSTTRNAPMPNRQVIRNRNKLPLTRRISKGKGPGRTKTRKTKKINPYTSSQNANNQGNVLSMLSDPILNGERSWIDKKGNVALHDDYDEQPFLNQGLEIINNFNAAGHF